MNWIKLTAPQASAIAALSATNTTNNYVRPRLDASGNAWLSASILNSGSTFAHYAGVLGSLTPTHYAEPQWPASTL